MGRDTVQKTIVIWTLALGVSIIIAFGCHASTLKATGNAPKLMSGGNLLAVGVYQDAPGSSDASVIVKLLADGEVVIDEGSPVKYIEPKGDVPSKGDPIGWAMPGFDDSRWKKGVFGVGYGDGDDNTMVGSKETTLSIYTRAHFNVPDAPRIKTLTLNIDYDDSVVVWLNGVEVARSLPTRLPEAPHWDDQCGESNTHEASKRDPPRYESVKLRLNGKELEKKGDKAGLKEKVKRSPLDQLASEIEGAIVYSRDRHIYKVVIGDREPIDLGRGEYARWSPDGKRIAVYDRRKVFVMDADGSNRKLVTDEGWSKHGCPIEFHTNGREIIFIRRNKRGLWAVNIANGKMRKLADFHNYSGEPGISADGTRMAARVGHTMYAIDLIKKTDFAYAESGCSSGISPDGKWLTNNRPGQRSMNILSWDGKNVKKLRASIIQPDGGWDDQTWSNHNDYITARGNEQSESYVINVPASRGTRVTWVGGTAYPDLYVADIIYKTQDIGETQDSRLKTQDPRQEKATLGLESGILSLVPSLRPRSKILSLSWSFSGISTAMHGLLFASTVGSSAVGVAEDPSNPAIVLVNKNYNRLTSRVLIRRVLKPTRANLDYAAYDSNVMCYDPTMFQPNPPPEQALSDLHFDKTLVPDSLTDRLGETPLTPEEKAAPMAWLPVTEYLMDWDFDLGYALAEAGWKISEDTWNDHRIPRPYQEISRVYLHTNKERRLKPANPQGTHSIWVRVEFKPWVKFLKDVDDEDSDGFPEIYGMIDGRFLNEKLIQRLLSDYTRKLLSPDEIADWGHTLGTDWYDDYYTRILETEEAKVWPNDQTEPEVKAELGGLVLKQPDVIIHGRPFGQAIYNVFLLRK